jgi:hypothetical protein
MAHRVVLASARSSAVVVAVALGRHLLDRAELAGRSLDLERERAPVLDAFGQPIVRLGPGVFHLPNLGVAVRDDAAWTTYLATVTPKPKPRR